jgi:hypothetical protein
MRIWTRNPSTTRNPRRRSRITDRLLAESFWGVS